MPGGAGYLSAVGRYNNIAPKWIEPLYIQPQVGSVAVYSIGNCIILLFGRGLDVQ